MKISLILPVLNGAATLERCLDSVKAQAYEDLELIVVDGASQDASLDIVKRYGSLVSQCFSRPDKSTTDAFNTGLRAATGEIIGFLNADDWLAPDALKRVALAFEDANLEFFGASVQLHSAKGQALGISHALKVPAWQKECYYQLPVPHVASYFERSLIDKIGLFNERYRAASDQDFFIRMVKLGVKARISQDVLAHVQLGGHADSYAGLAEKWLIASHYNQGFLFKNFRFLRYFMTMTLAKLIRHLKLESWASRVLRLLGSRHGAF